ncbi:hypothetical protein [Cellulomonas sp. 73-92]|uniref:hypothetical protein n=1 Tax=Cellulomonas sp. 73-92 TaxID=1895740 RepID=UPI000B1B2C98|nr:hypothetical protein [Cellulomonas sp. 73-92]
MGTEIAVEGPAGLRDSGGYNAWLTTPAAPGWLSDAIDQLTAWLRWKGLDVDLTSDAVVTEGERLLRIRRHHKDGEDAFRLVLSETNEGGHWTTTVTTVEGAEVGWVGVRVVNDGRRIASAPRIARNLLDVLDLRDGPYQVRSEPLVERGHDVEGVLDLIVGDRRGAVFVAGTDAYPGAPVFEEYVQQVKGWTSQAVGLAHVVVLDPVATQSLGAEADGAMRVSPWTIRTFRPGLDPASPATLRGHRTLGTATLARERDAYLARLIGLFARSILDEQPEPRRAAVWRRTFDRLDSRDVASTLSNLAGAASFQAATALDAAVVADAAVVVEAEGIVATAEVERIRTILSLPDVSDETLQALADAATAPRLDPEQLSEAIHRIDSLQDALELREVELEEAKREAWDARQDAVDLDEEIQRMDRRNRRLARLLAEHGVAQVWVDESHLESELDAPEQPGSWQDLVNRMDEWAAHSVVITADRDVMVDLDGLDLDGRALEATWRGLRALAGYVRAKREGAFDGGFGAYLNAQPQGFPTFPPQAYAPTETKETMDRWGHERDLPVPLSVDSSGHRVMEQHLRLARIANRDPRLHFYDDTSGATGSIIVGYIGPHLTNMKTAGLN